VTTFNEWKSLPTVRDMLKALVGDIGLDQIPNWSAYKHAVYLADRSQIIKRAEAWIDHRESEEVVAFAAVLWTMDYASFAGEICQKAGVTNVFGPINYQDDTHRKTVVGAFAMVDRHESNKADETVLHLIRQIQADGRKAWQLGWGSASFELLTAAYCERTGHDLEETRQRIWSNCKPIEMREVDGDEEEAA